MGKRIFLCFLFCISLLSFAFPAFAEDNNCFCWYNPDLNFDEAPYCKSYYIAVEVNCENFCSSQFGEMYASYMYSRHEETISIYAEHCAKYVDPSTVVTETSEEIVSYLIPELSVPFRSDFAFSPITKTGSTITIGFLGDYISSLYQWLIGTMILIAIVMIMVRGVQYIISGTGGNTSKAMTGIRNAVIGLILLMSVVTILEITNPELTLFRALTITDITETPLLPYGESTQDSVNGTLYTALGAPTAGNILILNGQQVADDMVTSLENAAKTIQTSGYGMIITSGVRSMQKQLALIAQNCKNPAGSATCDPKENRPQTCILKDNDPKNCPHTTGHAVDIWASHEVNGTAVQCIDQKTCLSDLTACFENDCQKTLISAMQAEGFCVLATEPWHFEKPQMSTSCRGAH